MRVPVLLRYLLFSLLLLHIIPTFHRNNDVLGNVVDDDLDYDEDDEGLVKQHARNTHNNNQQHLHLDDEEAEEYDDEGAFDEDYTPPPKKQEPSKSKTSTPFTVPLNEPVAHIPYSHWNYMFEYMGIFMIFVYVLNFFYGSQHNSSLARRYHSSLTKFLSSQFVSFDHGVAKQLAQNNQTNVIQTNNQNNQNAPANQSASQLSSLSLYKESESTYLFYVTGRRFIEGGLITIELKRRQDLFSLFCSSFVSSSLHGDTVTFEFALSNPQSCFLFLYARKKHSKALYNSMSDMSVVNFTKNKDKKTTYACITELPEMEQYIIDEHVQRFLSKSSSLVYIHLSDNHSCNWTSTRQFIRFQFELSSLSSTAVDEEIEKLSKLMSYVIDRVGDMTLTANSQRLLEIKRKKLAEKLEKEKAKQRQDELLKRKDELRRKQNEIVEKDPNSAESKEIQRRNELKAAKAKKRMNTQVKILR